MSKGSFGDYQVHRSEVRRGQIRLVGSDENRPAGQSGFPGEQDDPLFGGGQKEQSEQAIISVMMTLETDRPEPLKSGQILLQIPFNIGLHHLGGPIDPEVSLAQDIGL